jgi:outer membrane lipoprotein-sorting protein
MTILLTTLIAISGAGDLPPVDAFLRNLTEKRAHVQDMTARFQQKTVSGNDVTYSHGALLYVRPRRIVFRYIEPELVYLIDGLSVYEYDPELEQVRIVALKDSPDTEALYLGFENDPERLEEAYRLSLFKPEEGREGAIGLELEPKDPQSETAFFQRVRLSLRAEDYLPYRIHIVHDAEAATTLDVADVKTNVPIDPRQTQVELPPGTVIVEPDESTETVGIAGLALPLPIEPALPVESKAEPAGTTAPPS